MRIGICDDMREYITQLRNMCERYSEENSIKCEISEFLSGEEVIEYKGNIDVLFLDIEMGGGIDGIETMESLLKKDNVWKIVFVTGYDEKFRLTYGLKTLGYISKPVDYAYVEKWLDVALEELKESRVIQIKVNNEERKLKTDSVIYMTGEKNNTYIISENEKYLVSGNIKYWDEQVNNTSLVRIHKSYIINMDYVVERKSDFVRMTGCQDEIPIGRTYRSEFKEKYTEYINKKIYQRM